MEKIMIKEKSVRLIAAVLILAPVFALYGCYGSARVADDEIALQIKLDIKEDIGLLVVNYTANGISHSGGVSNANKSLLKHGEIITYTLSKQDFDNQENIENMSVQFEIITEYVDPNYENIYPAEYTKPLEPIDLKVNYGNSYNITISGNKSNGYKAVSES